MAIESETVRRGLSWTALLVVVTYGVFVAIWSQGLFEYTVPAYLGGKGMGVRG